MNKARIAAATKRIMAGMLVIGICGVIVACASDGKGHGSTSDGSNPSGVATGLTQQQAIAALAGNWKLASLNGSPIITATAPGARVPGFSITPEGGFSGLAGVNRMSSRLDLAKLASGGFSLAPVATTMMAGPPELMKLEQDFTGALGNARRFSLDGGALVLKDGTGAELARLIR